MADKRLTIVKEKYKIADLKILMTTYHKETMKRAIPYRSEERHERAFRRGLRDLQDRGQENHETYRHAGTGHLSASCLQLCDPCGREEERADSVCPAQVHHSRRQEADSGNV